LASNIHSLQVVRVARGCSISHPMRQRCLVLGGLLLVAAVDLCLNCNDDALGFTSGPFTIES